MWRGRSEELSDDGGYTLEVSGPGLPFEARAESGYPYLCLAAWKMNVLDFRSPDKIHSRLSAQLKVVGQSPRIGVQIFVRAELGGVDKDGADDRITGGTCGLQKRAVTSMESSHCGNEPYRSGE